jgi:hypothetical protein
MMELPVNIFCPPDRRHVEDVEKEVDEDVHKFSKFIHNLKAEIKARKLLLTALEQAEGFYHNQRGEVKVVANVSIYILKLFISCFDPLNLNF